MTEKRTWTAKEIGQALDVTERAVHKRAKAENWPYVRVSAGRGPKVKAYAHSGLPVEIQAAILKKYAPKQKASKPKKGDVCSEVLHEVFDRRSQKQKDVAASRLNAVLAYHSLVEAGTPKTIAKAEVAKAHATSQTTLYHWLRKVDGLGRGDWLAALAPGYVGRTASAEITPEAWEVFKADYLRLEQPALTACYERLRRIAEERGWVIPSARTFDRKVKKDIPHSVLIFLREGDKALQALYPPQKRDKSMLRAGEWINGDGYKHNVFVRFPDGHIDRPKTWFWQDVYSNYIMAFRTDMTEHTDMIRLSFLDLCDLWGIPEHVTIDNTMAAANKIMSGGIPHRYRFKVRHEDPLGLFPQLGVTVHWATPGHGQAKPVERAFGVGLMGEHVDKHPALAGAWCGNNPNAKPENYGSKAIPLEEFLKIRDQGVRIINTIINRNTDVCGGVLSYEQAYLESYEKATINKLTSSQRRKLMLCAESIRVSASGIITMKAGKGYGVGANRYWSKEVVDRGYCGKPVVVRFDPQHLHDDVHVYTLNGNYIGPAACQIPAGFGDTEAAREHAKNLRQYKKAEKAQAKAIKTMEAIEAAKMLPETPEPDVPDSKVVALQFSKNDRQAREEQEQIAVNQDFYSGVMDPEPEEDFDADAAFAKGVALMNREEGR